MDQRTVTRNTPQSYGDPVALTSNQPQIANSGVSVQGTGNSAYSIGKIYPVPRQFTLFADNSAGGAAVIFKMQSADNLVELANGTQGASSFTVPELPNRAGLAIGGATLTGVDGIRGFLMVYALRISYINYSGSTAAQLNNPLLVKRAAVDGTSSFISLLVGRDISNQQYNATLVPVIVNMLLTANHCLSLSVNAGATATLVFATDGIVPYNQVF